MADFHRVILVFLDFKRQRHSNMETDNLHIPLAKSWFSLFGSVNENLKKDATGSTFKGYTISISAVQGDS